MKATWKAFFGALIFMTVVISCSKEEDEVEKPSNTSLLTSNDWKLTNMEASPPFDTINIWILQDDCYTDNVYSFNKDGSGAMDESSKLCEPGDPQTAPLTWAWGENENTLSLYFPEDTLIMTHVEVGASRLQGRREDFFFEYITLSFSPN